MQIGDSSNGGTATTTIFSELNEVVTLLYYVFLLWTRPKLLDLLIQAPPMQVRIARATIVPRSSRAWLYCDLLSGGFGDANAHEKQLPSI